MMMMVVVMIIIMMMMIKTMILIMIIRVTPVKMENSYYKNINYLVNFHPI